MVTPSRVIPPNLIQNVASISASSLRLTFEPSFRVSGIKVVNFIGSPLGRRCGQSDNGQHDSTGASFCRPVRRIGGDFQPRRLRLFEAPDGWHALTIGK